MTGIIRCIVIVIIVAGVVSAVSRIVVCVPGSFYISDFKRLIIAVASPKKATII